MANSNHIVDLPLEKIMGDRFGRYSKYIIQDRALPDVRDGLKPVQRRILYAMHEDKNTFDKNFRKSAKTVGTVIGNYHPHGDSSVYEAMVRLSQPWKMRYELIEMHGNNGSVDGDPAAAMRYTEARLSKISAELMKDIDKDTVDFVSNFDDTHEEPTVFPAKLPNLLINGSTGISSGYATNIPPHNLHEIIDAVMYRMDKPESTVDDLMKKVSGPDFPTGGIVQGLDGIKKAFETGKGKVVLRGKAEIEKVKGGREQIVITEIPYEVNKANLVRKMDELHFDRKVDGIQEVVDESDRQGLRIVVSLKKDADSEGILNYFYKNTDLQTLYHYNMVAIHHKTPKLLSLPQMLDAYIAHQKEVMTRQTQFDLQKAEERLHIVQGLIKAISILDELIQTIRQSKNKSDAKANIIKKYEFTDRQAEAILALQLYRLTNTDITQLTEESDALNKNIKNFKLILSDANVLLKSIKDELKYVKKTYKTSRLTQIEDEIESIKINIEVTIPNETTVVSLTKEGYIKRTSLRSYGASKQEDLLMKSGDFLTNVIEIDTTDFIMLFTNLGKYVAIPVYELPDIRWKDMGQHLSNLTTLEKNEYIVNCIPIRTFDKNKNLVFFTEQGMVKKSTLDLYESTRFSRTLIALNLRDGDQVVDVVITDGSNDLFIATEKGYGLRFNESEVSAIGLRAVGVIGINLKDHDRVVNGLAIANNFETDLVLITQRGACKRMKLDLFQESKRARRGQIMLRELKTKPHEIVSFIILHEQEEIVVYTDEEKEILISPYGLPINDRQSNGSFILDTDIDGAIKAVQVKLKYETPFSN